MAEYRLTNTDVVFRVSDNASIPNDPGNRDRQIYTAWRKAGNVPDAALPEPAATTPQQKLEAMGLTVADIKVLLK